MAFLARCPHCLRPQRIDKLGDVDIMLAGDVFVRCNDWSNCGEPFVASQHWIGVVETRWPIGAIGEKLWFVRASVVNRLTRSPAAATLRSWPNYSV
jgi:hypothetical protein